MNLELGGKVAIVTGASRGLGRAAALSLAEEGVKVLGVARSADQLKSLQQCAPHVIKFATCDMEDLDAVADLPNSAIAEFGRLDIVVNNAGIAPAGTFAEQGNELWQRVFAVNVFAPVALSRAAGHFFLQQGSGKIINIASTSGILGKPLLVAYSASKGALIQMTKALASEWAPHGVQVNAIAPGAFKTDAQSAVLDAPDLLMRRLRKIPSKRMGQPDEVGPIVCLLASPWSNFIAGSVIVVDGGESAKL